MIYRLRYFENNFQILSSLGWILIFVGIVTVFTGPIPGGILFSGFGGLLVWLQLRGKRITVDTQSKTIKAGGKTIKLKKPTALVMREVNMSQTVNSIVNSANVKMHFYKACLLDEQKEHWISCNRKETRDLANLKRIAEELNIPFQQNY